MYNDMLIFELKTHAASAWSNTSNTFKVMYVLTIYVYVCAARCAFNMCVCVWVHVRVYVCLCEAGQLCKQAAVSA